MPPPTLVLWDIDFTLIASMGLGRAIYQRIFSGLPRQQLDELTALAGRTDREVIIRGLRLRGDEPTERTIGRVIDALVDGFRARAHELSSRGGVLPGAQAALSTLDTDEHVRQSVLTGNVLEVARMKLEAFGLTRYLDLDIGAYGDDHADRAELVPIAVARTTARTGFHIGAQRVVLIGDTPNDVAAAQRNGARAIAVATGRYSAAELAAAGAHTVFDDLTDTAAVRDAVLTPAAR